MPVNLMSLVAYGASDIYLTGSNCNINNIEPIDDINYNYHDMNTKHIEEIIFDIIYFNIHDIFIITKYNNSDNTVYI
jgi:hypothetical protein